MSAALEILVDACNGLPLTVRKMFGGFGLFAPNGGMFAGIVTDDEIILKLADDAARTELITEGGHPWVYDGGAKPMTMREWVVVPSSFYDDHDLLSGWAKRAHRLVPAKKVPAKKTGKPQAKTKRTEAKASKAKPRSRS